MRAPRQRRGGLHRSSISTSAKEFRIQERPPLYSFSARHSPLLCKRGTHTQKRDCPFDRQFRLSKYGDLRRSAIALQSRRGRRCPLPIARPATGVLLAMLRASSRQSAGSSVRRRCGSPSSLSASLSSALTGCAFLHRGPARIPPHFPTPVAGRPVDVSVSDAPAPTSCKLPPRRSRVSGSMTASGVETANVAAAPPRAGCHVKSAH